MSTPTETFDPGPRYRIVRRVGQGGMGVVYEATDLQYSRRIAIKTLKHSDPQLLFFLKQEFRALADVRHPNLIALYELFAEGDQCFFTMEYVDGVDLLRYVRGYAGDDDDTAERVEFTETMAARTVNPMAHAANPIRAPWQLHRLRDTVGQIGEGLDTIHRARKLHRDLKPSNILVTPEGRTVILDFGLMSGTTSYSPGAPVAGTLAYMSPEQSLGEQLTPASDWYSVGTIVYEALTGVLPFSGDFSEVMRSRLNDAPPPVLRSAPWLSAEWERLTSGLLKRDRDARWTAREVLEWAGRGAAITTAPPEPPFVGRDDELRELVRAFDETRAGKPACVFLHGDSGVGKSELMHHAARMMYDADPGAVFLSGRCYEQEEVPFKAVDGLVDRLSDYLRGLPEREAARVLPTDTLALARVFPVLRQCAAIRDFRTSRAETISHRETRRRAFSALRELLVRLSDTRAVVLIIDDLQWGDADSAMLLREIMRPPDAPALLLIAIYRKGYENRSKCLELLRSEDAGLPVSADIALEPLSEEAAVRLAIGQMGASPDVAVQMARESGGNPYFLTELLRRAAAGTEAGAVTHLDSLLWERISQLDAAARRFVIVTAIAGQPLEMADVFRAAGVGADPETVAKLKAARLVRTLGGEAQRVDVYHDRVRETVANRVDDPTPVHAALAAMLDGSSAYSAELKASHWHAAGNRVRAGQLYAQAAKEASDALAFDHAAQLYDRALELQTLEPAEELRLRAQLADSLANAGRAEQAARAYSAAAARAGEGAEALRLEGRAAYQFCTCGKLDDARAAFERVFARARLRPPKSLYASIASTVTMRLLTDLRGLQFHEATPTAAEAQRLDAAWYGGTGFGLVDPVAGPWFTARNLVLALRAGDPHRIIRAISWEAATRASGPPSAAKQAARMFAVCEELVERYPDPHSHAVFLLSRGTFDFTSGLWAPAHAGLSEAERILTEQCRGVRWEIASTRIFQQYALIFMGEIETLRRNVTRWLDEARDLGDQNLESNLLLVGQCTLLTADGRPEAGLDITREVLARRAGRGLDLLQIVGFTGDWWRMLALGRAEEGWESVRRNWPVLTKYFLDRSRYLGTIARYLRARLAVAAGGKERLQIAERDARILRRTGGVAFTPGMAACIEAGLAARRGNRQLALERWREAWRSWEDTSTFMLAYPARREYGLLLGGDEGREHVAAAEAWMTCHGIRDCATISRTYVASYAEPD